MAPVQRYRSERPKRKLKQKPLKMHANIRGILAAYRRSVRSIYCRVRYTQHTLGRLFNKANRCLFHLYAGDTNDNQYHADLSDLETAHRADIQRYKEIVYSQASASPIYDIMNEFERLGVYS